MPSTAIDHLFYDLRSRELTITFVTGREYIYAQVPEDVYRAFRAAGSKGRFFNFHIRDRFAFREVKNERFKENARRDTASGQ